VTPTTVATIRVPATSANLGPGFDCLGLALDLYLEVVAEASQEDAFLYDGEGILPNTSDNLIHQGFRALYGKLGLSAPKVCFVVQNPIPLARGLGSSSAALVAGAALADAWLGYPLGRDGVFQLCAAIEGHPDNVAPAVYGGFTVSALDEDGGLYRSEVLPLPGRWRLLFAVPDFELFTSQARAVLPAQYSRQDAIFNASRTALWACAVALDKPELLRVAAQDRFHEPYRERLVPGMGECRTALLEAGAAAVFLSGAGPTLAAILLDDMDEPTSLACEEVMRGFVGERGRVLRLGPGEGYRYQPRI
jgi:homoserine kinase